MAVAGQVVIGPPGSGKTTYSCKMCEFLRCRGRDAVLVNLDPANSALPCPATIDITELITVHEAMESHGLGPNGALVFCMEVLEENLDCWLLKRTRDLVKARPAAYLILDLPGQVELFTHHGSLRRILERTQAELRSSFVAVHLVDAIHCLDRGRLVSVVLLSLLAMLRLELPHVNVLSKCDLIAEEAEDCAQSGNLLRTQLDIHDGSSVLDLSSMMPHAHGLLANGGSDRFSRLNIAISNIVNDFGLVSFYALSILDKGRIASLVEVIDRCSGYRDSAMAGSRAVNGL